MRARDWAVWVAASMLMAAPAIAAPSASASAGPSAPPLPPGHPSMPQEQDDEDAMDDPHAHVPGAGAPGIPGMFKPPPDTERDDPSLPPGTIAVELRDPDDKPLSNQPVTLGIMQQSVAKGDSRDHKSQVTDGSGSTTFAGLSSGAGIAYRVTSVKDGATFGAMPFQLAQNRSMRVVLHVYPVSNDVKQALVVTQGVIGVELRDDRIQFEQLFEVSVFGRYAWMPKDVLLTLPEGFTALNAQQSMSDQGIDPIEHKGARLHGTFPPGRHQVMYRWQLPWSGERDVDATIALPPHVATMRVVAAAGGGIHLEVAGFPPAVADRDEQGQSLLKTEKRATPEDPPMTELHLSLRDLPTQGPARWIASGCAAFAVAFGIVFAAQRRGGAGRKASDTKSARAVLLAELEELERAHRAGDIGPKTYEKARRGIVDAIARTLADPPPKATA